MLWGDQDVAACSGGARASPGSLPRSSSAKVKGVELRQSNSGWDRASSPQRRTMESPMFSQDLNLQRSSQK